MKTEIFWWALAVVVSVVGFIGLWHTPSNFVAAAMVCAPVIPAMLCRADFLQRLDDHEEW